jgi:hypothetical protein
MMKKEKKLSIPDEIVMNKIYVVRGQKVMVDSDLAELYGVETRVLNQAETWKDFLKILCFS